MTDDALELDLEHARLAPLTVGAEGDVTHHRLGALIYPYALAI